MRISVVMASLLNLAAVSISNAQCQLPLGQMNHSYVAQCQPVRGCYGQSSIVYPSVHSSVNPTACYRGCPQPNYAIVSTTCGSSCGSVVPQPQVVCSGIYAPIVNQPPFGTHYAQPYTGQPYTVQPLNVVQQGIVYSAPLPTQTMASNDCNCGSAHQSYSQSSAQLVTPLQATQGPNEIPRNPFSLSGYAQPSIDESVLSAPCLMQFLRCCKYGGKSCAYDYYLCSRATGEQMKHRICPGETPVIDE